MDIIKSILALKANAKISINGETVNDIIWHDGNPTNITNEQILAKQTELQTAYDNNKYQRDREVQYPSLKEFAEAYTEKEINGNDTKWIEYKTKYNKVRTDNPKS
tara:strand:+ start:741 stop:1055 length:315 start_codon:yes stop_codon:yes gene_type:complete